MDYHRAVEIIDELYDYDSSIKVGRVGSSVTIGEIVEMAKDADTIERQAKQTERMMTTYADDQAFIRLRDEVIKGLEQERDAALAEVERLKGARCCRCHRIDAEQLESMLGDRTEKALR